MATWHAKLIVSILVAALFLCSAPSACQAGDLLFGMGSISGDTSSDGAVLTIALFATIVIVLGIIGLKSDVENVFAGTQDSSSRYSDDAFARRISLVIENPQFNSGIQTPEQQPEQDFAENVGIGLRLSF